MEMEISNSDLSSSQDFADLEQAVSPSLGSVDSPIRSGMSSNVGSPATDAIEEMDCEQTLVAVVTPNNTTPNMNATVATEQPIFDISKTFFIVLFYFILLFYYIQRKFLNNTWQCDIFTLYIYKKILLIYEESSIV